MAAANAGSATPCSCCIRSAVCEMGPVCGVLFANDINASIAAFAVAGAAAGGAGVGSTGSGALHFRRRGLQNLLNQHLEAFHFVGQLLHLHWWRR